MIILYPVPMVTGHMTHPQSLWATMAIRFRARCPDAWDNIGEQRRGEENHHSFTVKSTSTILASTHIVPGLASRSKNSRYRFQDEKPWTSDDVSKLYCHRRFSSLKTHPYGSTASEPEVR